MNTKTIQRNLLVLFTMLVGSFSQAALFECYAGSPTQIIHNVEARSSSSAESIARRICYENPVDKRFRENCYNSVARCTEIEGSEDLENYQCYVGAPMKLIENILAGSKDEAGRIARRLCYENPENKQFKENCNGSPVYCSVR